MKLNKIQPSCKIIEHNQFKICLLSNITQSICLSVFFWSSQEGDWLARSVSKARFRILTPTRLALRDYRTFSLAILTDVFHCQFSFWHLHSGHDCSSGLSWQSWQKMCPSGHWNTCKGPFFMTTFSLHCYWACYLQKKKIRFTFTLGAGISRQTEHCGSGNVCLRFDLRSFFLQSIFKRLTWVSGARFTDLRELQDVFNWPPLCQYWQKECQTKLLFIKFFIRQRFWLASFLFGTEQEGGRIK